MTETVRPRLPGGAAQLVPPQAMPLDTPRGARALPEPMRDRWQPLRIGLVDMFYYDIEEFWFRDGRLLLRGNNGTGKSKVLALTLPFLLDGDLSAHRVEPDADPKKRMEWNLLLGGEHPHPERLGYTWIEFGRVAEDGTAHYLTLGCGLKAVSGRGIARHWYFVVPDRRIGADSVDGGLRLLDGAGAALARDRLADAISPHGMVYDSARSYRRAVDEALFGLGEQRYAALVDLLVQLRQPQLSKRPSEKALSKALTEALPPMDQAVLADVAEALRTLDEEREELAAMESAQRASAGFLTHYQRYARVAARRKARVPRVHHSRYESLRAELNDADTEYKSAGTALREAEARLVEIGQERAALRARDEVLRASPEMRSARELEQAVKEAARTGGEVARATADADRAEGERARAAGREAAARDRLAAAERAYEGAARNSADAASGAGVADAHERRVLRPLDDSDAIAAARTAAEDIADRRLRAVAHLEEVGRRSEEAGRARDTARRRLEDADAELARRANLRTECVTAAGQAGSDYHDAVRGHFAACTVLRPRDVVGVLDELAAWTTTLHGPDPARAAADRAAAEVADDLAERRAATSTARTDNRARHGELTAELEALLAGRRDDPKPPPTRGAGVRDQVPGAPLWRLVDHRPDGACILADDQRAGLEAALEAAGLLDAWIAPDGLAPAKGWDTALTAGPPVSGTSLADVLVPAVDRDDPAAVTVSDEVVADILARIGLVPRGRPMPADGSHVSTDGRFRLGTLTGRWHKPLAEYLGETARELARRARTDAIETELVVLDSELRELEEQAGYIARLQEALVSERTLPDDARLRSAHAATAVAERELSHAAEHRTRVEEQAAAATAAAEQAGDEVRRTAAELDLPADTATLRVVREALHEYRTCLAELWPAVREHRAARDAVATETVEHARAAEHAAELDERLRVAAEDAAASAERRDTLQDSVGAAVADLQAKLEDVARRLADCDRGEKTARDLELAATARQAAAETLRVRVRAQIDECVLARTEAIETLRRFAATGLLAVALPEMATTDQSWAPEPAVRLARAIERQLEETDDADPVWERVQRRITEELKELSDALARHGHTAAARMLDDGLVVDVVFQGRERSVPELSEALEHEVEDRRRLLSAREQEILENHLITEVAGTLQELIGAAERQVVAMNRELADRPTSTGMELRLVWKPSREAPAGLHAARERLLRQTSDAWTPADRAALGEFLQAEIDQARTNDPAGSWLDHLTTALDYRTWHTFHIERHQHGKWVTATGPASGGERVLSVSLPLFAAASSHYASAENPYAPRLVTLDEAFAGVDDDSRAKSLGLLAAFDLDVVMTSEREWGCYPEVPGLAIAQLSRVDGIAAVLVSRWEWDGRRRHSAEPSGATDDDGIPDLFA
ncbi:TIGR02680 family protein [Yinghuangia sp. ASG 101]|uniref:TIGR02680 family protein n=1 Tax=Yinghuangia sp. ASG 101 TaxID=2896848 RepID=UPI001E386609|nr:TIGR02680 family protein [Yinghuangia sp. ASG 101]UGQ11162.1 TIGR02680 family protein [Yinghuangia sp. ASG 101]